MNGVVSPEEFDYFHEMIVTQELSRTGTRSFNDGNLGGMIIGLPGVLNHARPELRDRVAKECLSGRKKICLAISEAFAGSDVAGLKTTAVKSADGKHYIVNGEEDSIVILEAILIEHNRNQKMDHQWNVLGLFCHRGEDAEGILGAFD
jgi:alkylation response protein AidB-like acyl-CoA dehydrogenase